MSGGAVITRFAIGDRVEKVSGYPFPGEVRAAVVKRDGTIVYVVECVDLAVEGMLHIFNPLQLRPAAVAPPTEENAP